MESLGKVSTVRLASDLDFGMYLLLFKAEDWYWASGSPFWWPLRNREENGKTELVGHSEW
jgi:hypothetical protein